MSRRGLVVLLTVAALASAAPAGAAVTCTYNAGTARVSIFMSAPLDELLVRRIGNAIGVGGTGRTFAPCGAATVTNTNRIVVAATGPGQQALTISLESGRFQPGKSRESTGVSEIEFEVDLGAGSDGILVNGGSAADNFRLGTGGSNLNGDGDVDVLPNRIDGWRFTGNGGGDRIGVHGGLGTGAAYSGGPFTLGETTLIGGAGNDVLTGGPERESFSGGGGNDALKGGGGNDLMYGDSGADRLDGGADGDGLYPGNGNDVIIGGGGRDFFGAEPGLDGADDFRGGPGVDRAGYYERTGALRIDLDGTADDGLTGEHDNIRPDVEDLEGGSGADRLTGSGAANELYGLEGADRLDGGGGDDTLVAGGTSEGDSDTVNGGAGDDLLEGGGGADVLNGGPDEDEIFDDLGNDAVNGGPGNDLFDQGSAANGADAITGGGGFDQVEYSSRAVGVSVSVNNIANDGASGENDNVRDDVEVVVGSAVGDTLTGNGLNNFLGGGGGNDVILGFDGIDRLLGDAGTDSLTGGDGFDHLNGGADGDTLNAIDSSRDEVVGGPGTDTCNTDAIDQVSECP